MFIELIESLRCPRPHEDSWLVGAFDTVVDRHVRAGRLGCPVCRAEYPIVNGTVWFDPEPAAELHTDRDATSIDADAALRLAAMLDLASPGGIVVLEGEWTRAAGMLAGFVEARLLLLNPPAGVVERDALSGIVCRDAVPIAAASCRGIAIHAVAAAERLARSVAVAMRTRGRLVIPAAAPMPEGFEVLARDASWAVAERSAPAPALVSLATSRRN